MTIERIFLVPALPANTPLALFVGSPSNPVKRFELANAAVLDARQTLKNVEFIGAALVQVLGRPERIIGRPTVLHLEESLVVNRILSLYCELATGRASHGTVHA